MDNLTIDSMSLYELKEIKSILEERLLVKKKWRDLELGKDFDEYNRRDLLYVESEYHSKLLKVSVRIKTLINEYINAI